MKNVIGMANVYFTYWEVSEPYKEYTSPTSFYWKVDYWYRQNLSMDLEAAKAKVEQGFGVKDYIIDLSQRGYSDYSERIGNKLHNEATGQQFAYGKLEGQEICTCKDVYQLERLIDDFYNSVFPDCIADAETNSRLKLVCQRAAVARRRLINLDVLVKYPTISKQWNQAKQEYYSRKLNYTYAKNAAYLEAKKKKTDTFDHYFNDGEKATVNLKEVESFSFDTQYGSCWIVTYLDDQGRGFKYMGSSPPSFITEEQFTPVKGTVCHDEYKGVKETKLKRISLVK